MHYITRSLYYERPPYVLSNTVSSQREPFKGKIQVNLHALNFNITFKYSSDTPNVQTHVTKKQIHAMFTMSINNYVWYTYIESLYLRCVTHVG